MPVLGLAGGHGRKLKNIEQVRGLSVPNPYHCATDASSLDGEI